MVISNEILKRFLEEAAHHLQGDWVILGGTVPYLMGAGTRPTMDIDLAGPETATQSDTLVLMKIAESLSLPIEAINQSAAFFLHRIPNWQKHLVLVRKGQRCNIFRPDLELFFRLKLLRANEADIDDLTAVWQIESDQNKFRPILKRICQDRLAKLADSGMKTRVSKILQIVLT